jgi:hypothetical protein
LCVSAAASTTRALQGARRRRDQNHASGCSRHCRSHGRESPQVRPVELRPHVGGRDSSKPTRSRADRRMTTTTSTATPSTLSTLRGPATAQRHGASSASSSGSRSCRTVSSAGGTVAASAPTPSSGTPGDVGPPKGDVRTRPTSRSVGHARPMTSDTTFSASSGSGVESEGRSISCSRTTSTVCVPATARWPGRSVAERLTAMPTR